MMKNLIYVLLCFAVSVSMSTVVAQNNTRVTGIIISAEEGEPITGASVMVKGTSIGSITNLDGRFEFNAPSSAKTLVISYVGMVTQEVAIRPDMRV
ncbi:TonB-dependent receptor SusC, partial [termite gut metagenome]